jgi:MinD superfamily P-loop ATPase
MEIPFDKEIAMVYSEGKLIAELNSKYSDKFMQLLQSVKKELKR